VAGDRVRDEAERLVAAAIAAVSLAARGMGGAAGRAGSGSANGSPECCVCPVCRVIAAMRDPGSDLGDKLAAGAGDLATGVAALLRTLSRAAGQGGGGHGPDEAAEPGREGDEFWDNLRRRATGEDDAADPWRTATTTPPAPKPMAKKAIAKKAVKKAPTKVTMPDEHPPATKAAPAKKVAKKAVKKAAPPPPEEFG
jgi:hypothetical protein